MKRRLLKAVLASAMLWAASCGPSGDAVKTTPETKETVYARGHQLYLTMHGEEAERELGRAAAMDSAYGDPLVDLGSLWYDRGMKNEGERRSADLRKARAFLARAEELGCRDALVYDRLCETCTGIEDAGGFLKYSKKNAERYPFDRQNYNLCVAYFGVEDWAGVVKTGRAASEKFKDSQYIGAFYRQVGRAYMKMDRDQTAERTLEAGVQAVDARMGSLKKNAGGQEELRRLQDDKIGMLLLLKRLYTTYREPEKLAAAERQLREAGYTK
jgi:hypothetical protein